MRPTDTVDPGHMPAVRKLVTTCQRAFALRMRFLLVNTDWPSLQVSGEAASQDASDCTCGAAPSHSNVVCLQHRWRGMIVAQTESQTHLLDQPRGGSLFATFEHWTWAGLTNVNRKAAHSAGT